MPKTALVTGVTAGFGAAICERLLADGWQVIGTGRRENRLETLRKRHGERFYPLSFDVGRREAVRKALTSLPESWQAIDLLVNNAGLALGLESAPEASMDDWETMVDANIKGPLYLTRSILPGMVERRQGHIVNIGSIAGDYPYPGGNVYGATKAFVAQFTRNLRADLLGTPVRVTNIAPGLAETEFSLVRFKGDRDRAEKVYAGYEPLTAEDIADCVAWCIARPAHVNINFIEVMPTQQAWGPLAVKKYTTDR